MRSSHYFKAISRILIFAMLHLCWFSSYGYAEMIPTESANQVQNDRQRILDLLDRQDVVEELEKYGISKVEAVARINSLSDEGVAQIAERLDELPAGAGRKAVVIIFTIIILTPVCIILIPLSIMVDLISMPFFLIYTMSGGEDWPWESPRFIDGCAESWGFDTYSSASGSGPESSDELKEAAQCYSRCHSISYECINSEDTDKSESQCETEKQTCYQQCETSEHKRSTYEDDCDPGMESCT